MDTEGSVSSTGTLMVMLPPVVVRSAPRRSLEAFGRERAFPAPVRVILAPVGIVTSPVPPSMVTVPEAVSDAPKSIPLPASTRTSPSTVEGALSKVTVLPAKISTLVRNWFSLPPTKEAALKSTDPLPVTLRSAIPLIGPLTVRSPLDWSRRILPDIEMGVVLSVPNVVATAEVMLALLSVTAPGSTVSVSPPLMMKAPASVDGIPAARTIPEFKNPPCASPTEVAVVTERAAPVPVPSMPLPSGTAAPMGPLMLNAPPTASTSRLNLPSSAPPNDMEEVAFNAKDAKRVTLPFRLMPPSLAVTSSLRSMSPEVVCVIPLLTRTGPLKDAVPVF